MKISLKRMFAAALALMLAAWLWPAPEAPAARGEEVVAAQDEGTEGGEGADVTVVEDAGTPGPAGEESLESGGAVVDAGDTAEVMDDFLFGADGTDASGDADAGAPPAEVPAGGVDAVSVEPPAKSAADDPAPRALDADAVVLGRGETFRLTVYGAKVTSGSGYAFTSLNKAVATVNRATGLVTAKAVGAAEIELTGNGTAERCEVRVEKAPSKVALNAKKRTLGVGESYALKAALPKGSASKLTFSSSDKAVATVNSATGAITAKKKGTATITVRTFNGKKASCAVTVKPAPKALSFGMEATDLGLGEEMAVAAARNAGSAGKVTCAVEGAESISYADGLLRGLALGEAALVATAYNGVGARLAVRVVPAPEAVALGAESVTLGKGETMALKPGVDEGSHCASFSYSSDRPSVARVSASGVITAKAAGTAVVTVTTYNGVSAGCEVRVVKAPSKVALNVKKRTMGVGETYALKATLPKGSASRLRFSSSDKAVAAVSAAGVITAKKTGTATITVRTFNGRKASCAVTVKPAPKSLAFPKDAATLGVGEAVEMKAERNAGSGGAIGYRFEPSGVAKLKSGTLTGLAEGETTLTARTYNGLEAELPVRVVPAPTFVKLPVKTLTLSVNRTDAYGKTYRLQPEIDEGSHSAFRYSSDNARVASVSAAGVITAKKKGTATVTVRTYNGWEASVRVTVKNVTARALLVGQSKFRVMDAAPRNAGDVKLMYDMLRSVRSPEAGAFSGHITRKYNLTAAGLKSAIASAFSGAGSEDVSLFFIATHGVVNRSGAYAGALVMTDRGYVSGNGLLSSDMVRLSDLASWLSKVKGKVVVFIESCGSGAAIKSRGDAGAEDAFARAVVDAFEAADPGLEEGQGKARTSELAQKKFYVLTASDIGQNSYGSNALGYNFFTRWLTNGVGTSGSMPADANGDGRVTLSELRGHIAGLEGMLPANYGSGHVQNVQAYPSNSSYALFRR